MVNFNYDGSYPLERLTPPKGITFRQCTIRKWTVTNCRIASKRRCCYILDQLPLTEWVRDFWLKVNLPALPDEIEATELELCQAVATLKL